MHEACAVVSAWIYLSSRRGGGLFGSGDSTGSIGVVTINLPRIAYTTQNKKRFFSELDKVLHVAKDSLETKRKWIEEHIIKTKAIPAFCEYVGKIDNYFLSALSV